MTQRFVGYLRLLPRLLLAEVCDEMAPCKSVVFVDSVLGHLAVAHQCAIGGDPVRSVDDAWQVWCGCLEALP